MTTSPMAGCERVRPANTQASPVQRQGELERAKAAKADHGPRLDALARHRWRLGVLGSVLGALGLILAAIPLLHH
jgi:hypothetical protein